MPQQATPGNFNPRSPCGERRSNIGLGYENCKFQSTLPVRGATFCPQPRPESLSDFNPRSPCGERRDKLTAIFAIDLFQSTLPVRGATILVQLLQGGKNISIHAPRAGSDLGCRCPCSAGCYFNPRSPCGERRTIRGVQSPCDDFNPRSPCGERQNALAVK